MATGYKTIDEYIATFPEEVQKILEEVRQAIAEAAPEAEETISYQMPAFKLGGKLLVYFGAHTHHIGFYPTPSGIDAFTEELAPYDSAKGSVKFPLDEPMPLGIIEKITKYRVKEITEE